MIINLLIFQHSVKIDVYRSYTSIFIILKKIDPYWVTNIASAFMFNNYVCILTISFNPLRRTNPLLILNPSPPPQKKNLKKFQTKKNKHQQHKKNHNKKNPHNKKTPPKTTDMIQRKLKPIHLIITKYV